MDSYRYSGDRDGRLDLVALARHPQRLRRAHGCLGDPALPPAGMGRSAGRAQGLGRTGVIRVFSQAVFHQMSGWSWGLALAALVAGYLYLHYGFASMTAHTTALYPAFLAAAIAAGVPPMLAALHLAFFSNLNACLTHYG